MPSKCCSSLIFDAACVANTNLHGRPLQKDNTRCQQTPGVVDRLNFDCFAEVTKYNVWSSFTANGKQYLCCAAHLSLKAGEFVWKLCGSHSSI